jgi:hypothetical protein
MVYANCDQHFPYESDMWPELSRSNMRDMLIRRSTEIERRQRDVFSRDYARLSINARTIRHA